MRAAQEIRDDIGVVRAQLDRLRNELRRAEAQERETADTQRMREMVDGCVAGIRSQTQFFGPICKGSFALGTACGQCDRCRSMLATGQAVKSATSFPGNGYVNPGNVSGDCPTPWNHSARCACDEPVIVNGITIGVSRSYHEMP